MCGYNSNCKGEAEETVDQLKNNNSSAFENDAIPNFSSFADFSPDSAKSSHLGIPNLSGSADFCLDFTYAVLFFAEVNFISSKANFILGVGIYLDIVQMV